MVLVKVTKIRGSDEYDGTHGTIYNQYLHAVDEKGNNYQLKIGAKSQGKWGVGDKFEADIKDDKAWKHGGEEFFYAKASKPGMGGNGIAKGSPPTGATRSGGRSEGLELLSWEAFEHILGHIRGVAGASIAAELSLMSELKLENPSPDAILDKMTMLICNLTNTATKGYRVNLAQAQDQPVGTQKVVDGDAEVPF